MTNKKHTKKNYLKDAVERITMMLLFISLAAVVAWFILVSMQNDFADNCIWINNSGQCLTILKAIEVIED